MEKWNKPWVWVVGIIVLVLLFVMASYNRLISLDQGTKESWAQVENQLQRRNDLIPNLVSTVKGYAKHESAIFIQVSEARATLAGAMRSGDQQDKVDAAKGMDSALSRLLAIAENYPNLKANENFVRLQDELAGTENRIAVERMRYNQAVNSYNTAVRTIPTVLFVKMFGFERSKPFFQIDEGARTVPNVKF